MTPADDLDASGLRIDVVVARFNVDITGILLDGALRCLEKHGASDVDVHAVPGAFELPLACLARAAAEPRPDALVALGCVIRGDTPHFDYVAGESARGLMQAMMQTGVPIAFGVLTTDDREQAQARAGGEHGNKGWDAALSAIEMAALLRRFGTRSGGA